VLEYADIRDGDVVLDVGAGTGLLAPGALERVGEGDVIALDPSAHRLEELERVCRDPRAWYQIGESAVLPLPDAFVDVALAFSTLADGRDADDAARELYRVLRPGGRASLRETIDHPDALLDAFERAGFAVEHELEEQQLYLWATKPS
jgi:ubiquinone/menaquinone biosynthesis C-methylase UbiE